jgi:nucleoside-diphosphate-sugar epimerase
VARALISGGTGAIGSAVARRLLGAGWFFARLLDYAAEDRYLASRAT